MFITELLFKTLTTNAICPRFLSQSSPGLVLFSAYDYSIAPWKSQLIQSDIAIELLPKGCYGRIAPFNSAVYHSCLVGAGVIDRDYRGNIGIILFNLSNQTVTINAKSPVAQLICEKYVSPILREVSILSPTLRNINAFGSSGMK